MITRNQEKKTPARELCEQGLSQDPMMYNQAIKTWKHVEWKKAEDAELVSLEKNQTYIDHRCKNQWDQGFAYQVGYLTRTWKH